MQQPAEAEQPGDMANQGEDDDEADFPELKAVDEEVIEPKPQEWGWLEKMKRTRMKKTNQQKTWPRTSRHQHHLRGMTGQMGDITCTILGTVITDIDTPEKTLLLIAWP